MFCSGNRSVACLTLQDWEDLTAKYKKSKKKTGSNLIHIFDTPNCILAILIKYDKCQFNEIVVKIWNFFCNIVHRSRSLRNSERQFSSGNRQDVHRERQGGSPPPTPDAAQTFLRQTRVQEKRTRRERSRISDEGKHICVCQELGLFQIQSKDEPFTSSYWVK